MDVTIQESLEKRARIYVREIKCVNCINYEACSKQMRNPEVKHLYDTCFPDIYAAFREGQIDAILSCRAIYSQLDERSQSILDELIRISELW